MKIHERDFAVYTNCLYGCLRYEWYESLWQSASTGWDKENHGLPRRASPPSRISSFPLKARTMKQTCTTNDDKSIKHWHLLGHRRNWSASWKFHSNSMLTEYAHVIDVMIFMFYGQDRQYTVHRVVQVPSGEPWLIKYTPKQGDCLPLFINYIFKETWFPCVQIDHASSKGGGFSHRLFMVSLCSWHSSTPEPLRWRTWWAWPTRSSLPLTLHAVATHHITNDRSWSFMIHSHAMKMPLAYAQEHGWCSAARTPTLHWSRWPGAHWWLRTPVQMEMTWTSMFSREHSQKDTWT